MYSVPLPWNRWCGPFMPLPVLRLYVFVELNPSPLPTSSLGKSLFKPLKINDYLSFYNTAFRNLLGCLFLGLSTSKVKCFNCMFSKTLSCYNIRLLFFTFCFLWKQRTALWNLAYNNFSYACWPWASRSCMPWPLRCVFECSYWLFCSSCVLIIPLLHCQQRCMLGEWLTWAVWRPRSDSVGATSAGVQGEGRGESRHSSAAEEGCGNLSHRHASAEDEDLPRWEASSTEALIHLLILSLNDAVYEWAIQMEGETLREGKITGWSDYVQGERPL